MSNNWRASLVPAAAVIPAPIAYIKVVAVKKLVVGSRVQADGPPRGGYCRSCPVCCRCAGALRWALAWGQSVYFEKIRVLKAGVSLE